MRKLSGILTLAGTLVVSLLLPGCFVSRPPYPADWPAIAAHQDPNSFQGTFPKEIATLIDGGETTPVAHASDSIRLRLAEDLTIQLSFPDSSGAKEWVTRNHPTDRFYKKITSRMKKKGLVLIYHPNNTAGSLMVGPDVTYCRMSMLTDGSMVMKKGNWFFGLVIFLIPTYGSEYKWVRITRDSISIVNKN